MQKLRILILSIILFQMHLLGQDRKFSVHQWHRELYGKNVESKLSKSQSAEEIIPLNENIVKNLDKVVFGYLPDWEYADNAHQYFRYDLLTHIACFDFIVSSNGTISNPAGWPWNDLINEAHSNGVKVILRAVNFDGDEISSIINNESSKQNFFSQVKQKIETYQLDGINIDFESLNVSDRTNNINNFMADLTSYVHSELPGKEVSFAAPVWDWSDTWDQVGLANSCDYIFVMGYAFAGSWSDNSGPGSPLTGSTSTSPSVRASLETAKNYLNVVQTNPGKLIVGIPYYGLHWTTTSSSARSTTTGWIGSTRFRAAEPLAKVYGKLWDTQSQTPWIRWNTGEWNQVWYDDNSSLGLKYDLVFEKNLMGVGMWALGYDGERQELWNLIDYKFGSGVIPPPSTPEQYNITIRDSSTLVIDFEFPQRATGFELFGSYDAETFYQLNDQIENTIAIEELSPDSVYYFKTNAYNENGKSINTEVLGAIPSSDPERVLVVHGFDRVSNTVNNFDYIKRYGQPFLQNGFSFSSASNEAIFNDRINLNDYKIVVWILGDESTADETFNQFEQERVQEFLKNGGRLFVSGAEIGWDLYAQGGSDDKEFYNDYLKADYIADAPNNQQGTYYSASPSNTIIFNGLFPFNFDDGTHGTFDVDWPDAIEASDGAVNILEFTNVSTSNGYAGVAYEGLFPGGNEEGKLVYLSIPFETIYPENVRVELLGRILDYLNSPVTSVDNTYDFVQSFKLYPNYPNPFNPSTKISFEIPVKGRSIITIYNVMGEETIELLNKQLEPGYHEFVWDASGISSGMYIARVRFTNSNGTVIQKINKMLLIK